MGQCTKSYLNGKIKHMEPLGFHPRPHQGDDPPGPAPGEITLLEETNSLRLLRWGYEKFEGFWPKKARKIPRGKFTFSWGFSLVFPDAKHPDWRFFPQAQSSQVRTADIARFA